jgi:hypothetical protein
MQDYRLYKTHWIRYYDEQGSNKEPSGIRSWKWLHAPRCYSAEHTLPDYTIFFKRRAQCIQDWCQWHSETTWTRGDSRASVYPSPMWCWIMCWSAPDSHEVEWKNQPGTSGWGNTSHITRLLPSARMDYPAQYRWEISLPLISITRLLQSTTSNTRFQLSLGGCSTSETIIFMTTSFRLYIQTSLVYSSSLGGYL